jgi:hypothetical protein
VPRCAPFSFAFETIMTTTLELLSQLCVVCADAPTPDQRSQADELLCQELTARLQSIPDRYDTSAFGLSGGHGGVARAGVFAANIASVGRLPYPQALGGGSAVGVQETADPRAYGAVLSVINSLATDLVASASAMSSPGWLTARRRVVDHQRVAPGGDLLLLPFLETFAEPDGSAFAFAAGSYRVELEARIWVDSAANPATASFELLADGADALALSGARVTYDRSSGNPQPADDARRLESTVVTMTGSLTLASTKSIALKSTGSVEQGCIGILRVMPA